MAFSRSLLRLGCAEETPVERSSFTMKSQRSARTVRFYYEGDLDAGSELALPKQASHHLITVLRMRKNDTIELFNGDGYNYQATVLTTEKYACLQILAKTSSSTESDLSITLAQAISRGDRMDSCIRQSVELGVNHIQPLYSRHSVKVLDEKRTRKRTDHWLHIIVSACEQSGRTTLPTLADPISLQHWLQRQNELGKLSNYTTDKATTHYILTPTAPQSMSAHLSQQLPPPNSIAVIIGPESGFDSDEIDHAVKTGVSAVQFGPRILRTETAGPACIAMLQSALGDLGDRST